MILLETIKLKGKKLFIGNRLLLRHSGRKKTVEEFCQVLQNSCWLIPNLNVLVTYNFVHLSPFALLLFHLSYGKRPLLEISFYYIRIVFWRRKRKEKKWNQFAPSFHRLKDSLVLCWSNFPKRTQKKRSSYDWKPSISYYFQCKELVCCVAKVYRMSSAPILYYLWTNMWAASNYYGSSNWLLINPNYMHLYTL